MPKMLDGVTIPKGDNILASHLQSGAELPYFDLGIVEAKERFILPTAKEKMANWRLTLEAPAEAWAAPDFNDAAWTSAPGGFGQVPDAAGQTLWKTPDIWLRREFNLKNAKFVNARLRIAHDDEAEVYLNGVLTAKIGGFNGSYTDEVMSRESIAALQTGVNIIAVHCHQTVGAQFIDVGIADEIG